VKPRFSPRCGTMIRTRRPAARRQPRFERLALVRLGGHVNFRRRAAQLVELLIAALEHAALARSDDGILGAELDTLDDAGRAGPGRSGSPRRLGRASSRRRRGAELDGRIFCWRSWQRLNRAQGVARLRRFLETLAFGRVQHALAQRLHKLVVLASRNSCVTSRRAHSRRRTDRVDTGRDAALDVRTRGKTTSL